MNNFQITPEEFTTGSVLLIDKPLHWTSFQAVNKIKWLLKSKLKIKTKVGHAGTLDPLATGLLIICTGKKTKSIEGYQAQQKEYTGTFYIGATTPCFDLEKEIDFTFPTEHISEALLQETKKQFVGKIQQVPPIFSAVKVDGKRAYDIARAGGEAIIKPKEIEIYSFELTRIALPEVDFKVTCTKGTYIRSLARDFGLALNSGAHLIALRRTKIGDFSVENAFSMDDFQHSLEKLSLEAKN
jgi:tRNA pseudouridine55 synthase